MSILFPWALFILDRYKTVFIVMLCVVYDHTAFIYNE